MTAPNKDDVFQAFLKGHVTKLWPKRQKGYQHSDGHSSRTHGGELCTSHSFLPLSEVGTGWGALLGHGAEWNTLGMVEQQERTRLGPQHCGASTLAPDCFILADATENAPSTCPGFARRCLTGYLKSTAC